MNMGTETDSSLDTSSGADTPPPPKKRFDGPGSSRTNGGGSGKERSSLYSAPSGFQRNGKGESFNASGEGSSNAMDVDDDDNVFKLNRKDFPEYNEKRGWQSPTYKVQDGQVQPRVKPPPGKPTKHTNVLDFIQKKVIKSLKVHLYGWPFVKPVNTIELPAIYNYHTIIKRPMDLTTIENRIKNQYYLCAAECIRDIEQMFDNCFRYNPPEYPIYQQTKVLKEAYKGQMAQCPTNEIEIPLKAPSSTSSKPKKNKKPSGRRASRDASVTSIGSERSYKRKATPLYDLLPFDAPAVPAEKRMKLKNRPMPDYSRMTPRWKGKYTPKMEACKKIVNDLMTKKSYRLYVGPFALPVDVEKLQLYDYYDVCPKPMDLSSIKKQFEYKLYLDPEEFRADMLLVFQNCFKFNNPGDAVHVAGIQLIEAFDKLWSKLPAETKKPPKVRPSSSMNNTISSMDTSMNRTHATLNGSTMFAPVPPSPAILPMPSCMETPKVQPSSSFLSLIPSTVPGEPVYAACDDDEMIQALLLRMQHQNVVYTEKMSLMQRLSQDLLTLQMHRIAARATNCAAVPPPVLPSEAVTRIMRVFEPANCMPVPIPTLTQEQLDDLRKRGLAVGSTPRSSNMPQIIGEVPLAAPPSVPQLSQPSPLSVSQPPVTVPENSTPAVKVEPTVGHDGRSDLSSDSEADVAKFLPKVHMKRYKRRDPKKSVKTFDYEFDSDAEDATAPLSYDQMKVISYNINLCGDEIFNELIRIVEYREQVEHVKSHEVEIDFDRLRPITLRELRAFVLEFLRVKKMKPFVVGDLLEKEEKDSKEGIKMSANGVNKNLSSSSAPVVDNGGDAKAGGSASRAPPSPKATVPIRPLNDELNLSSSDSSSDSDDSSSSSDSSSDSDDDSDMDTGKSKYTTTHPPSKVSGGSPTESTKPKLSPPSSFNVSPMNANGSVANKAPEVSRQPNGKHSSFALSKGSPPTQKLIKPSPPTSKSLKSSASLAFDPLSVLDQPTIRNVEKPALPKHMSGGTSFEAPSRQPSRQSDTYHSKNTVDLSSQISMMANFEDNF